MIWWGRRKTDPPTVKPGETTVDPPAPPVFTQGVRADLKLSGGPPSNVMQFPDPKNKRLSDANREAVHALLDQLLDQIGEEEYLVMGIEAAE